MPKATDPESLKRLALDNAVSKFEIEMAKVTKTHRGSLQQSSGFATPIDDELQSIVVEVDTASIRADDPDLTSHIKTADFLDVERFPKATVKSSSRTRKPAGSATHDVNGALTLHGVTPQATFPATVEITPSAVKASGQVRMDRQKFGVSCPGNAGRLDQGRGRARADLRVRAKVTR